MDTRVIARVFHSRLGQPEHHEEVHPPLVVEFPTVEGAPTPEFDRAKAALDAEERRSTKAQIRAASEAARRHGYI